MAATTATFARRMTRATIAFALLALACGVIGFYRVSPALRAADGLAAASDLGRFFDVLYMSLGMLGLGTRNTYGADPFLSVGRWFGVMFVFSAVLRATLPQVLASVTRQRVRTLRGHAVVIGLGEKGRAFARALASRTPVVGMDVLATERADVAAPRSARSVLLLTGDATKPRELERLNLARAERATICTGDDVRNHAIARRLVESAAAARNGTPLDVTVHLADDTLASTLMRDLSGRHAVHLRPFSLPAIAARNLCAAHPCLVGADRVLGGTQRWLYIGWDAHAEALLVHATRLMAGGAAGLPSVTVLVRDPDAVRERIASAYPVAQPLFAGLRCERADAGGLASDERLLATESHGPTTAVFVFGETDAHAFSLARRARDTGLRLGCWHAPVFVRMDDPAPWTPGLSPIAQVKRRDRAINPWGSLRECCSAQALGDWHERIARELHEAYRASAVTRGASGEALAPGAARPWTAIPEEHRASNRRAADHLLVKLHALGYLVRGGRPLPRRTPSVDAREDRLLARLEHESWVAEKRLAGWTQAAVRDDERRHHDRLVPFESLHAPSGSGASALEAAVRAADAVAAESSGESTADAGAFRETVVWIACHRDAGVAGDTRAVDTAALADALHALLADPAAGLSKIAADDDAFVTWTLELATPAQLALARAVRDVSRARRARSTPGARFRLVAVDTARSGGSPQDRAAIDAWLLETSECDACVDGAPASAATGERTGGEPLHRWRERCDAVVSLVPADAGSTAKWRATVHAPPRGATIEDEAVSDAGT